LRGLSSGLAASFRARALTDRLVCTGLYCSRQGKPLLEDVSLSLSAGEMVILQGANGTGKSTLLEALAGVLPVDAGVVQLGGQDVTDWPLHRRAEAGLGYLPQGACLIPGLDVWSNVAVSGASTSDMEEMLGALSLMSLIHRPVGELSGGERRRVELARCMVRPAEVLLLDEPLWGLDTVQAEAVWRGLSARVLQGAAVLIADPRAEWNVKGAMRHVEVRGRQLMRM
jgi:lipopolysaccharide export system ATP-binding protein